MKTRYITICATIFLLIGIVITILSFEITPSEPLVNLPEGMVPITPTVVGSEPIGNYMIIVSILVLIGTRIHSLIDFKKLRGGKKDMRK